MLCCFAVFVCLTLLASFFLPSHLSFKNMYVYIIHSLYMCTIWSVECHGFESHPRQLIFLRKSNCRGCAVLFCLVVCLTLLVSFFLPSHLSLKHVQCMCIHVCACVRVYCAVSAILSQSTAAPEEADLGSQGTYILYIIMIIHMHKL